MSLALTVIAAWALLPADFEANLAARFNVAGGASPLDAQSEEVPFLALELSPAGRLRYLEGALGLDLTVSPRFTQRFVFAGAEGAPAPDLMGPIAYVPGELALRWRASARTSLELSANGGYGTLSFNDAVASGQADEGAVDSVDVATVGGRMSLSSRMLPRGDTLRLNADVATTITVTDGPFLTTRDRARFSGGGSYLFAPTRVDGLELAASGETSLYLDGGTTTNQADQASFLSGTVGWVRRFTRRSSGALRAGLLVLLNDDVSLVPSVLLDWSVETYQSPGLRITTTLSTGIVGGTSSVDAVAEPRVVASLDMRFAIVPSRSFGIGVSFNAPIPTDRSATATTNTVPSPSVLLVTLPFSWQLDPGFDLEMGVRLGLRGVLQTDGTIPVANGVQLARFGETYDAQGYVGFAFDVASSGESRYER